MSHFKATMHQILFPASARPSVRSSCQETDGRMDSPSVRLASPNPRIAMVPSLPCGHQRFCSSCANRVRVEGRGCSICRTDNISVLNLY